MDSENIIKKLTDPQRVEVKKLIASEYRITSYSEKVVFLQKEGSSSSKIGIMEDGKNVKISE